MTFKDLCIKVFEYTERNYHTEALLAIANFIKDKNPAYSETLMAMQVIQKNYHSFPIGLLSLRGEITREMLTAYFSEDEQKALNECL